MANNITGYIWVLDTPSATAIWTSRVKIIGVYWENPLTIGDTFVLQETNGNLVIDGRCETANQSQVWRLDRWYNGLIMPILSSGIIKVTIG